MTCAEFQEQVEAYALGALEPEERAAMDAHLAGPGPHQGCERALFQAQDAVARLSRLLPLKRPSPEVWRRIEAEVSGAPPLAALTAPPRRPWREALAWGMAATASVALAVTSTRLAAVRREAAELASVRSQAAAGEETARVTLASCRDEVRSLRQGGDIQRAALALMDDPGSRVVRLSPQPGTDAQGTAILNAERSRAILVSRALAPRPDRDYELWIIRGKAAPIPAGFVRFTEAGLALAEFDPRVLAAGADQLAVSREPKGGSPAPTEILMVGPVRT